jgi:predicted O-methyltransferase YrrM
MGLFDNMISLYPHVDKLHMRGDEASKLFPDEHFDLVYIDASHWYDDVVNDINTWLPKIKSGGYLAGHDYIECNDVLYVVNDYFGKTHSITRYPDSSWVIKKN